MRPLTCDARRRRAKPPSVVSAPSHRRQDALPADYEHVLASGAALSIGEPIVHYGAAQGDYNRQIRSPVVRCPTPTA